MDKPRRPGPIRLLVALAAMLAVLLPGAPAFAHNALAQATPAKGATVTKAPTSVKLKFLQKLNPDYTTITVTGAAKVQTSEPEVEGATGTVTFDALANGAYTVAYRVVSKDGHTVQGSYKFTVADPSATAEPTTTEPTTAAPATPAADESLVAVPPPASSAPAATTELASDQDGSGGTGLLIALIVAGLAVVALGVFLVTRRRKTS
ncbi:copper resistance CopC family protein [Paractinoplanes hotanensis]|uniref:Copper resistance protein CopC n=1 Tax=Paractinoplanes hotanensis TaxID=2906497 RepID=A0ABT0Y7I2_9ACTN|nr:copper resistance CopC family protein [Actinoplanes hotanensis]MCM4082000.1 copper resistance protein CopC [Actinoplanes hotanensis]